MQSTSHSLAFILCVLLFISCTPRAATVPVPDVLPETMTPETPQETYAGDYDVTVSDTPGGTVTGSLMLMEGGGELSGNFVSGGSTMELKSVSKTDDGLRISFYSTEYQTDVTMNLKGAPGADVLSGMTLGSYATVAKRKM